VEWLGGNTPPPLDVGGAARGNTPPPLVGGAAGGKHATIKVSLLLFQRYIDGFRVLYEMNMSFHSAPPHEDSNTEIQTDQESGQSKLNPCV